MSIALTVASVIAKPTLSFSTDALERFYFHTINLSVEIAVTISVERFRVQNLLPTANTGGGCSIISAPGKLSKIEPTFGVISEPSTFVSMLVNGLIDALSFVTFVMLRFLPLQFQVDSSCMTLHGKHFRIERFSLRF